MESYKTVTHAPAKDNISFIVRKRPPLTHTQHSVNYIIDPLLIQLLQQGQRFPLTIAYFSSSQDWVGYSYERAMKVLGPNMFVGENSVQTSRVAMFHASLDKGTNELKSMVLQNLAKDPDTSPLKLVLATIALGMGADLRHVQRIVHVGSPKSMQAYIQQGGRAGRSGEQSEAVLFFNNEDTGRKEVSKDMKKFCRNEENVCRRKLINEAFGFNSAEMDCAENCCDVCEPMLSIPYTYDENSSSGQFKDTLRASLMSYIQADMSGTLSNTLPVSIIEQIVITSGVLRDVDSLKNMFGLDPHIAE